MQTYLLTSPDKAFINKKIEDLKEQIHSSQYNTHEIIPSPSIGIPEARKIKEILNKKTFMGGDRLIIIREIEKATPEAANALLKILEEPPVGTYFILTTANANTILPTIVSRCQIISQAKSSKPPDSKAIEKTLEVIKRIINNPPGGRLVISQNIAKTRETTSQFLDDLIVTLSYLLNHQDTDLKLSIKEVAVLINKTAAAKHYLERNVNSKATLDILFLGFPVI